MKGPSLGLSLLMDSPNKVSPLGRLRPLKGSLPESYLKAPRTQCGPIPHQEVNSASPPKTKEQTDETDKNEPASLPVSEEVPKIPTVC